jgi:hypothetical protein
VDRPCGPRVPPPPGGHRDVHAGGAVLDGGGRRRRPPRAAVHAGHPHHGAVRDRRPHGGQPHPQAGAAGDGGSDGSGGGGKGPRLVHRLAAPGVGGGRHGRVHRAAAAPGLGPRRRPPLLVRGPVDGLDAHLVRRLPGAALLQRHLPDLRSGAGGRPAQRHDLRRRTAPR